MMKKEEQKKEIKMLKLCLRSTVIVSLFVTFYLFFMPFAHAEQKQFYLGLGVNGIQANLEEKQEMDWDRNAWGVNGTFGYRLSRNMFFQFDLDYVGSLEGEWRPDDAAKVEIDVLTGICSVKGYFPDFEHLQFTWMKPYVIAGVGLMNYEIDLNDDAKAYAGEGTDDNEVSLCYKIGLGLDFFLSDEISLGLDGSYNIGPTDTDIGTYADGTYTLDDIEYYKLTLGMAFHF
jgi:opacity protein-like surface antigen